MRADVTLATALALGLAGGIAGSLLMPQRTSVEQNPSTEGFSDLERRVRNVEEEVKFLLERTDRLGSSLDRVRVVEVPRPDARPASPDAATEPPGMTEVAAEPPPPRTASETLDRSRKERSPEDIQRFYRRMVEPLFLDLDPPITESQASMIRSYLATGTGKDWVDSREAVEKFLLQLPDAEQGNLVRRDAELENDVNTYIKQRVLTSEQLRNLPRRRGDSPR